VKKYPKLVQVDGRGVIVIPKDVRRELNITEGTGFWVYTVGKDGIFLHKVQEPDLKDNPPFQEVEDKAEKIGIIKDDVQAARTRYKRVRQENLDVIE